MLAPWHVFVFVDLFKILDCMCFKHGFSNLGQVKSIAGHYSSSFVGYFIMYLLFAIYPKTEGKRDG